MDTPRQQPGPVYSAWHHTQGTVTVEAGRRGPVDWGRGRMRAPAPFSSRTGATRVNTRDRSVWEGTGGKGVIRKGAEILGQEAVQGGQAIWGWGTRRASPASL